MKAPSIRLLLTLSLVGLFFIIITFGLFSKRKGNDISESITTGRVALDKIDSKSSTSKPAPPPPPPPTYCVSNDVLYFGQLTHNGNLNGQMKRMYEAVHPRSKEPFLKKENTFFFTDIEPSPSHVSFFSRITLMASKGGKVGYDGAQRRFLESIFTMLELKKERNDKRVRWFMLSDDDHMSIPANLMRTLAKYELKLERGELSVDEPLIIGRTPECRAVSGGAGVIFNEKAIEVLKVNMEECIKKVGLQWYDYTIYRCVNDVLTKTKEEKCKILKHETSMHCCNYMYFCDPSSFKDPPNLSWFNRFRKATGFHYLQGDHVNRMKENLPDSFFTKIDKCFPVSELEKELDGYMPSVSSSNKNLREILQQVESMPVVRPPSLDWIKSESKQQDESVVSFMTSLIEIIFSNWENQFASNRKPIDQTLERKDISIAVIPSPLIESRASLIAREYNISSQVELSLNYWQQSGFNAHVCESTHTSKISLYAECLKKSSTSSKWTLVVSESTRINSDSLLQYLKTFSHSAKLYIGGMRSAQELILSQLEGKSIGLPFGALFAVSSPFIEEYLSIATTSSSTLKESIIQEQINDRLLIPNTGMILSGGHFFTHAPEHYCTKGITNVESWIEMQVPTKELEPMTVTFSPTNNCLGRMNSINQFFNKIDKSLLGSPTGDRKSVV